jgi:hypothetical protein
LRRQGNDRRSHGKGTPLLVVEGANDRITLETVGVDAFARCSDEADELRAQGERATRAVMMQVWDRILQHG